MGSVVLLFLTFPLAKFEERVWVRNTWPRAKPRDV